MHTEDLTSGEYEPDTHGVQADAAPDEKVPAGQAEQRAAPPVEYMPGAQAKSATEPFIGTRKPTVRTNNNNARIVQSSLSF